MNYVSPDLTYVVQDVTETEYNNVEAQRIMLKELETGEVDEFEYCFMKDHGYW